MNIVTIEGISKSYGEKSLFENLNLTITDSDKIGLIGVNGTGKSTLLKIIGKMESYDSGSITYKKNVAIGYLHQDLIFDEESTVIEQVLKGNSISMITIRNYEKALSELSLNSEDKTLQDKLLKLSTEMKALDLWDFESQIKTILTKLGIYHFNQLIKNLSGGQKKRIALASALITPCDLLILDEPTNHLDNSSIDWLETYLASRKGALLMVTHDRYFLDRVVNKTIELDQGNLYSYEGNYTTFIEKKIERQNLQALLEKKRQNLYKTELAWIRTGAQARSTKQKARIQRFEELKKSMINLEEDNLQMSIASSRLGKKIIEINHVSKSYNNQLFIHDLSFIILKHHRIGIIGDNGIGKSTFLNMITGKVAPDSGNIDIGSTVSLGYYAQESEGMDYSLRSIDYVKEGAEYITKEDGYRMSASQIMESFLFTSEMQWTYISKLSGGEKRRLYLLRILMSQPNVLILDEPTNDLDIDTLKVLESYIDKFPGPVIAVSHDRYFLDRICTDILSFKGDGIIEHNTGNYSDYKSKVKEIAVKEYPSESKTPLNKKSAGSKEIPQESSNQKIKLTYKEKLEYEQLPTKIEALENQLEILCDAISKETTDYEKLSELTSKVENLEEELLALLERQEYFETLNIEK